MNFILFKLILTILLGVGIAHADSVNTFDDSNELQSKINQAQNFLSLRGIVFENGIPQINLDFHLLSNGHFNGARSEIKINTRLNEVQKQLSLIHELTHFYRYQNQSQETLWVNEGLANLMEYLYSQVWPVSYIGELQKKYYVVLSDNPDDYGPLGDGYVGSFLLMYYLYQNFGGDRFILKLLNSDKTGWDNILYAINELTDELPVLNQQDQSITKDFLLRHFAMALWFNDHYLAKYNLFFLNIFYDGLQKITSTTHLSYPSFRSEQRNMFNKNEIVITYTQKMPPQNIESHVWSVKNKNIKIANPKDIADVFIAISFPIDK